VEAAGDVRAADQLQQGLVLAHPPGAERLSQIGVEVDAHGTSVRRSRCVPQSGDRRPHPGARPDRCCPIRPQDSWSASHLDNVDRSGIVVAVSAGNEGPGPFTTGSPGSAERALTAGASTVGHFVGLPITAAGSPVTYAAAGEFPVPTAPLTAVLAAVRNPAGALAVVIVNNVAGDPIAMAADSALSPAAQDLPAVMAGLDAKAALLALDGQSVTIGSTPGYVMSGNDDIMAGFSSEGPVDVSYRVKPDVVAPGVNVLSSIPQAMCDPLPAEGCWAFFQGTSMASPHLAGMAAVVRAAHPAWDAWQVRSAIANTAKLGVLTSYKDGTTVDVNVQRIGNGLADLDAAVNAMVALSRPSISFGGVPSTAGQTLTQQVTVTNLTGSGLSAALSVADGPGAGAFSVSPASVPLPAGGSATVTVTFTSAKGAAAGNSQAVLSVGSAAHAALFAYLK